MGKFSSKSLSVFLPTLGKKQNISLFVSSLPFPAPKITLIKQDLSVWVFQGLGQAIGPRVRSKPLLLKKKKRIKKRIFLYNSRVEGGRLWAQDPLPK